MRDRARSQQDINDLTVKELQTREQMLNLQKQQAQADYNTLLKQIQQQGQQITGEHEEKYGGFLGAASDNELTQTETCKTLLNSISVPTVQTVSTHYKAL